MFKIARGLAYLASFAMATFLLPLQGAAQESLPFTITNAGELDLDTNEISVPGEVNEIFGAFVAGQGEAMLIVSVGDQSAAKEFTFQLSSTRLVSFLFDGDIVESIGIDFRRGLFGSIVFTVLDSAGNLSDSTTIELDITRRRSNCTKHPSPRLKRCARVNLSTAKERLRSRLAKKLLNSIRGPIVLEP